MRDADDLTLVQWQALRLIAAWPLLAKPIRLPKQVREALQRRALINGGTRLGLTEKGKATLVNRNAQEKAQ